MSPAWLWYYRIAGAKGTSHHRASSRRASPCTPFAQSRNASPIASRPEEIILFGSYAYGHPKPESDVDLLVIMDTPLRSRQQRLEISRALSPRPFPLDIIVRTPQELAERIVMGDLFLTRDHHSRQGSL